MPLSLLNPISFEKGLWGGGHTLEGKVGRGGGVLLLAFVNESKGWAFHHHYVQTF